MKSCRAVAGEKRRSRMMRKLFKKLGTGMTGKIHTQEAMAPGIKWADALAVEGAGPGNAVRIASVLVIQE